MDKDMEVLVQQMLDSVRRIEKSLTEEVLAAMSEQDKASLQAQFRAWDEALITLQLLEHEEPSSRTALLEAGQEALDKVAFLAGERRARYDDRPMPDSIQTWLQFIKTEGTYVRTKAEWLALLSEVVVELNKAKALPNFERSSWATPAWNLDMMDAFARGVLNGIVATEADDDEELTMDFKHLINSLDDDYSEDAE